MNKIHQIFLEEDLNDNLIKLLNELQRNHKDKISGIFDLYTSLCMNSFCNSYSLSRIYYVAYTLADKDINFKII